MLRIYDSLVRKVVPLDTRETGRITMYVCGPTVYNYIHIGNARTFVWFDFIRRYLAYRGFEVTFVMNYTDVDDRIIEQAAQEGVPIEGITTKYAAAFEADMRALGARPPDILALATEHVKDMVAAIEGLIDAGAAYEVDGDVFFSVESFEGYGKLKNQTLEQLRATERVEPHPGKRHPVDFALWKGAKEGEPYWPSPWGNGRPGWHIECSVMSSKYLGPGFDIHGGGADLIFPHHENEIAQAEALTGERFARHWMHSGMVQMEDTKMSKSLGNIERARDVVAEYGGEQVRYWCLMGSYRTQSTFSKETLTDASRSYDALRRFILAATHLLGPDMPKPPASPRRPIGEPIENEALAHFVAAMDDDFNSAGAFAAVHELFHDGNRALDAAQRGDEQAREHLLRVTEAFLELMTVLGFTFEATGESPELVDGLVGYLLELREEARAERAFDRADSIRARLGELGIAVEDTPAGARWRLT